MTTTGDPAPLSAAPQSLAAKQVGYKRSLNCRHVRMIVIGGGVGTGLFVGAGPLAIGWMVVRNEVIVNTGGRTAAVWSESGRTYGQDVGPNDLDPDHAASVIPT